MKNVFNFKKVESTKKDQVYSWLEEIREYLNSNTLVENWFISLHSGFAGYGTGRHKFDGTRESGELTIHTRKRGYLMDVVIQLFSTKEEIQERIELAVENRSKNSTGSYWIGGPSEYWVYNSVISKNNQYEWNDYLEDEWILKDKLVKKLRKYINKKGINVPNYISWFDTNWNDSIKLTVSIINPEVIDFNTKLNEAGFDTYLTY